VLAHPIVAVLFQHGRFTAADTNATAAALAFYAPGLIGYSVVRLIAPSFYALHDSRTPVAVSVLTVALNVVLSVSLVPVIGYRALALGTAVASLFNGGMLLGMLRTRLGGIEGARLATAFLKIAVASAVMAGATDVTHVLLTWMLPGPGAAVQLAVVATDIVVALAVLAGAAYLLRIHEFREAVLAVTTRFSPTRTRG